MANEASEILEKIRVNTQRVFNATKDRQQHKFLKLVQEKQASVSPHINPTPRVDKNKWVINLSSRPLSDTEVSLLKKGLNFAVTPTTIPATEIVAKVETAIRTLDSEQASIMILPADKGRASVVLDTNTYHDKMKTLIETGPYQLLNKDPTDRLSRKLTEKLLSLKRSGHLSESVYNKIRPKHKQPPRIYGQPKIHKPNVPLRPIVSCINTFAYDLSAHLADILSPLTGKSEYAVTNSTHFVNTINHERIQEKEIMVSFDIESLFTNVPIEDAVKDM